ncbi:hypothetical protein Micbo1qcDRAFT_234062 [Microdochium bolleyi]|uniref:Hemerythrin-like domain-containing protein n=1 Tax=Microdochium bolleyi TaxID=196109 RepID=A0A136J2W6_9PEZI|nr:hypothetical protein Micbo1qcDRAFT_234062 [Microdochium bolleyi]
MLQRITLQAATISRVLYRPATPQALRVLQPAAYIVHTRTYSIGSKYSFAEEHANLGGPSTPFKLSSALHQDYDQLAIFFQGATVGTTLAEKKGFQNAFVWELARHSVAKELVVFPAVEKDVPGGKELVEKERAASQEIKELLADVQDMKPDNDQFKTKLEGLYSKFQNNVKNLEEDTIQKLEKSMSLTQSKELCLSYERTKNLAPTRSHPNAPNSSVGFETASPLLTAPLDKLRDLFRTFPENADIGKDGSLSAGPKGAPYELHKKEPEQRKCP